MDVPHLNLHDRIHWVMQWVFNDPRGDLHGGLPATLTNASRELAWIARTFGQEPEPTHQTMDEHILEVRRSDARRARETNLHAIGRSIPGKKNHHEPVPPPARAKPAMVAKVERDDGENDDTVGEYGRSRSSSGAVSEDLQLDRSNVDLGPSNDIFRINGISLQTMKETQDFWRQQYAEDQSASEDSQDSDD
ncbi:unnamed protein product [Tilletia controversa]|nr:hypothetical protein CF335_g2454 [Tilletia laevis]CAD6929775.1 unnamed protein product [Tilletia controversa]